MTATPIDFAAPALREARPEVLVDAIVQLTHRIHGASSKDAPALQRRTAELREQRALVRAEVLRRIEATS